MLVALSASDDACRLKGWDMAHTGQFKMALLVEASGIFSR